MGILKTVKNNTVFYFLFGDERRGAPLTSLSPPLCHLPPSFFFFFALALVLVYVLVFSF
jgi:hypothetical protein